jgi:hypothetical protein
MKVVSLIREKTGYIVSPDAMFDVQVYLVTEHHYTRAAIWTGGKVHDVVVGVRAIS